MPCRTTVVAVTTAAAVLTATGCAVSRGQESAGGHVDDTGITTQVEARFVDDRAVGAGSMNGVQSVRNEIGARP